MTKIPVISVRQPYASEIMHGGADGHRDVINLSKPTNLRGDAMVQAFTAIHDGRYVPYPTGVIIGRVRIIDCLPPDRRISDWHDTGKWGVYLADPVPCVHIPHPGHPDERLPPCAFTVDLDSLLPNKPAWQWYVDWLSAA